jgi:hypothetical protein
VWVDFTPSKVGNIWKRDIKARAFSDFGIIKDNRSASNSCQFLYRASLCVVKLKDNKIVSGFSQHDNIFELNEARNYGDNLLTSIAKVTRCSIRVQDRLMKASVSEPPWHALDCPNEQNRGKSFQRADSANAFVQVSFASSLFTVSFCSLRIYR